jgi:hypothetical protein
VDDRYIFAAIIYFSIIIVTVSVLPNSLFDDSLGSIRDAGDLQSSYNQTVTGQSATSYNWFSKILIFLFTTWNIDGIPPVLAAIIAVINYCTTILAGVYIYDKLRGI